jgi:hypothetical protein
MGVLYIFSLFNYTNHLSGEAVMISQNNNQSFGNRTKLEQISEGRDHHAVLINKCGLFQNVISITKKMET